MNQENSTFGNTEQFNLFENIQELNNRGATCDTYKVRLYGKWHFLKRLKNEFKSNPLYIAAFEKEFDLGFHLDHPNIVRYYSKGIDQDGHYIISEYIEGLTLREFLSENPKSFKDKKFIKKLVLQILSVLDYLHNNQIIHLDIKPDNILITTKSRNIKLIDFGFSSSDGYEAILGGTPNSSSPEQFDDSATIDVTSDIFAFGRLLTYLFVGNSNVGSIEKLPQPYRNIANKCQRTDPAQRYRNIQEIIAVIESRKRFRTFAIAISVLALVVLLFSLVFYYIIQEERNYQNEATVKTVKSYDLKLNHLMDSLFLQFDKEFPKIELSNVYEVGIKYNNIMTYLFLWKENQMKSIELSQRPFIEGEYIRLVNERTSLYNNMFSAISNRKLPTSTKSIKQDYSNFNGNDSVVAKLQKGINEVQHEVKDDQLGSTNSSSISAIEDSLAVEKIMKSDYPISIKMHLKKYVSEVSTEKKLTNSMRKKLNELSQPVFEYVKANDRNLNKQVDTDKKYLKEFNLLFMDFYSKSMSVRNDYSEKIIYNQALGQKLNDIYEKEMNRYTPQLSIYLNRYD